MTDEIRQTRLRRLRAKEAQALHESHNAAAEEEADAALVRLAEARLRIQELTGARLLTLEEVVEGLGISPEELEAAPDPDFDDE